MQNKNIQRLTFVDLVDVVGCRDFAGFLGDGLVLLWLHSFFLTKKFPETQEKTTIRKTAPVM